MSNDMRGKCMNFSINFFRQLCVVVILSPIWMDSKMSMVYPSHVQTHSVTVHLSTGGKLTATLKTYRPLWTNKMSHTGVRVADLTPPLGRPSTPSLLPVTRSMLSRTRTTTHTTPADIRHEAATGRTITEDMARIIMVIVLMIRRIIRIIGSMASSHILPETWRKCLTGVAMETTHETTPMVVRCTVRSTVVTEPSGENPAEGWVRYHETARYPEVTAHCLAVTAHWIVTGSEVNVICVHLDLTVIPSMAPCPQEAPHTTHSNTHKTAAAALHPLCRATKMSRRSISSSIRTTSSRCRITPRSSTNA